MRRNRRPTRKRDAVLAVPEPSSDSAVEPGPDFFGDEDRDRRDLYWIIGGLAGFWGLVFLVLLLVVLLRR